MLISNGETSRSILARFDPTVDQSQNTPTDASKIAGGNRHGNHTEQRVTLDLADDYYQITSDAKYNYSKLETGKTSSTHSNVKMWHYFVNDIYFIESGEDTLTPYIVTINIKENNNGEFVYSYNAEKESPTRRTLHAGVNTYKGANGELFFDNSISQTEEKSTLSEEKASFKIRQSRKVENKNANTVDLQNEKVYNDTNPNGLTDDEIGSILAYKSGESYTLNAKLRDDIELNEYEQEIVNNLDKALKKLPTYKGKVYRDIQFDGLGDGEARKSFVSGHIIDDVVQYSAYTSTSTKKDGYPLDVKFAVHFEIESVNGRNLEGYGNNFESEVLFSRNSNYFTDKIEYDSDGTPTIYLTEVANEQQETQPQTADERGTQGNVQGDNSGKSRLRTHSASGNKVTVQSVQGESAEKTGEESAHNDLQDISERNAAGTSFERTSLRGVQTKIKHSRKVGINKVSVSELQLAKLKANYEGEKVFNQTDVNKETSLNDNDATLYNVSDYNRFGWARVAKAISKNELDDLYSKVHEKGSLKKFPQSSNGEAIIEVNDDPHALLNVDNVFVFVTGTKSSPKITRIVRVEFFDEDSIDFFRKDIYENTSHRALEAFSRRMGEELLRYYDRSHYADYRAYTEKSRTQRSRSESKENTRIDRNGDIGTGASQKAQGNIKHSHKAGTNKVSVSELQLAKLKANYEGESDNVSKTEATSEIDSNGNPIYETFENRKPIEPVNLKLLKDIRKNSDEKFSLSEKQGYSLRSYVMSSNLVNTKMRSGNITEQDQLYIDRLLDALNKFPVFEGRTYRNLKFKTEQEYIAFLEENLDGNTITLKAFTSTSKKPNGYPLFGKYVVHMVFDGVGGRDIADTYGIPRQQEVLYLPNTRYKVVSVSIANDGHPIIFVKEIANNEVQNNDGNLGGQNPRPNRDGRSNMAISREEGDVNGGVHGNRRGSEHNGAVQQSEVRRSVSIRSDENQTKVKHSHKVGTNKVSVSELQLAKLKANEESISSIKKLKSYMTEEEQNSGLAMAEFIESVNEMLDKSKRSKRMKKIGIISKNHADTINELMQTITPPFSADGYELWIDGTGAQHIELRHGKNGKADSTMASNEAKSLIPWAAQNAEIGEFIKNDDGKIKRSDRFYNSDGTRAPEIRLSKNLPDGKVYVSECVPDSANKIIWITSAYINKKGSKGQLLNIEDTSSPQPTPEASFDSNATTNSISQTEEKSTLSEEKVSFKIRESRKITQEKNDNLNEPTQLIRRLTTRTVYFIIILYTHQRKFQKIPSELQLNINKK